MARPTKSKDGKAVKCSITLSPKAYGKVKARQAALGLPTKSEYIEHAVLREGEKTANG